jgi:hypothetical protein
MGVIGMRTRTMKIMVATLAMVFAIGHVGPTWANAGKLAVSQILKQEPAQGTLRPGATALVDDGTCGAGKIKQVTGGDGKGSPRKKACVARPK